jgi:FlaA1/EpsC-like NDP-sugar epimerase
LRLLSPSDEVGPVTVTDPEMTRFFMTIPEGQSPRDSGRGEGENGAVYVVNMDRRSESSIWRVT